MMIIITDHFPSRASQGQFTQIVNKHCKNKDPNWPEGRPVSFLQAQLGS